MNLSRLPIVVIGAGPVGLAAAAHLVERGETPLVLEAGQTIGASVLEWGHVQLFSPWRYVVDAAAERLLTNAGWEAPAPDDYPTGRELVEQYLLPLAALPAIAPHRRLGHLYATQPARCQRSPGHRRERARGSHFLRHSRCARARARALRWQAGAGGWQWPLSLQRAARSCGAG